MGSALLPQETHNTNTGCLSPDNLGDRGSSQLLHLAQGCSRKSYPPHIHGNVLPPTVEPPASTPFRPPLPPRPTALQTFGHARVPPACTWLRSIPWLAREARHHLPELPRSFVLEPTRHMARTRAPDRHAKILPCRAFRVTAGTGRISSSAKSKQSLEHSWENSRALAGIKNKFINF